MAVITIDGKKLEVPDNKNVLECALDAGDVYKRQVWHGSVAGGTESYDDAGDLEKSI